MQAQTIATAIQIGNPINFEKAKTIIQTVKGVVEYVSDEEILAAKFRIDRAGIGCEPASAATLAGIKKLRSKNVIPEVAK